MLEYHAQPGWLDCGISLTGAAQQQCTQWHTKGMPGRHSCQCSVPCRNTHLFYWRTMSCCRDMQVTTPAAGLPAAPGSPVLTLPASQQQQKQQEHDADTPPSPISSVLSGAQPPPTADSLLDEFFAARAWCLPHGKMTIAKFQQLSPTEQQVAMQEMRQYIECMQAFPGSGLWVQKTQCSTSSRDGPWMWVHYWRNLETLRIEFTRDFGWLLFGVFAISMNWPRVAESIMVHFEEVSQVPGTARVETGCCGFRTTSDTNAWALAQVTVLGWQGTVFGWKRLSEAVKASNF